MATSGDYRNFFELDGVRYSHTIQSQDRDVPCSPSVTSVTVFARTRVLNADAYATALMAMGDAAIAWANEQQIESLFLPYQRGQRALPSVPSASFDPSRLWRPVDN